MTARSYLFAPGHKAAVAAKALASHADEIILDLEDSVPAEHKGAARTVVTAALADRPAWVRVNQVRTADCERDLEAVGGRGAGIRLPKVESPDDVRWALARLPDTSLICAIETARGVLAAADIAAVPGVRHLALGGLDLRHDLGAGEGMLALHHVRSHLVVASAAAGIGPPIDSVHPHLGDDDGLRREARLARRLGFFGKSAIHPRQIDVIHQVFTVSADEARWAAEVVTRFEEGGGEAFQRAGGEFVDLPVVARARRVLDTIARSSSASGHLPEPSREGG